MKFKKNNPIRKMKALVALLMTLVTVLSVLPLVALAEPNPIAVKTLNAPNPAAAAINADVGTEKEALVLPEALTGTIGDDDEAIEINPVAWECDAYDSAVAGVYTFIPASSQGGYEIPDEVREQAAVTVTLTEASADPVVQTPSPAAPSQGPVTRGPVPTPVTTFTVTFIVPGYSNSNPDFSVGTYAIVENIASGNIIAAPSNPSNPDTQSPDQNFIGWYKDGGIDPVYLGNELITGNMTLTARFAAAGGVVNFLDVNGTLIKTVNAATVGDVIAEKPDAAAAGAPTGATFTHWYDLSDATEADFLAQDPAIPVNGVVTLSPKVSGLQYISFNSEGGSPVNTIPVVEGDSALEPANPTKVGYSFKYWSKTSGGEVYSFSTPVNSSFTLYAVWEAASVGFRLVFNTLDSAQSYVSAENPTYKTPDKRESYVAVTQIDVSASESDFTVGHQLTAVEMKALAEEYYLKALNGQVLVGDRNLLKYYTYYETPDNDNHPKIGVKMPNAGGALSAQGTTVVNLFFAPRELDVTFDMGEGRLTSATVPGSIGLTDYTFHGNSLVYISQTSNQKYFWPVVEGTRSAAEDVAGKGVLVKHDSKVLLGWRLKSASLNGQNVPFTDDNPYLGNSAQFPERWWPESDKYGDATGFTSDFDAVVLEAVWGASGEKMLVRFRDYVELGYDDWLKLADGTISPDPVLAKFTTGDVAKYVYESEDTRGVVYGTNPIGDWTAYLTQQELDDRVKPHQNFEYKYNADSSELILYNLVPRQLWKTTFNANGGSWSETTDPFIERKSQYPISLDTSDLSAEADSWDSITADDLPQPTPPNAGMEFDRWTWDVNGNNPLNLEERQPSQHRTLYAQYKAVTVSVSFYESKADAADGTPISVATYNVAYGQSLGDIGKSAPDWMAGDIKEGLGKFKGWYYTDGSGAELGFSDTASLTGSKYKVYAAYDEIVYDVTFYDEDGSEMAARTVRSDVTGGGQNTLSMRGGIDRTLPVLPQKSNATVGVWVTRADNSDPDSAKTQFTGATRVDGDISVYPFYDNVITITYTMERGGESLTLNSEEVAETVGAPRGSAVTALPGYEFAGWYDGNAQVSGNAAFVPQKNAFGKYETKTYAAKFNAVIRYQSNNLALGTVSSETESVSSMASADAIMGSTATATQNNIFVYWADSHGTVVSTTPAFKPTEVKPETYTAIFKGPNDALIQYKVVAAENGSFGGTVTPAAESLLKDTGVAAGSVAASYEGFDFIGWYSGEEATDAQFLSGDPYYTPVKPGSGGWADVTYYAKFEEKGSVTINYAVGTGSLDVGGDPDHDMGTVSPASELLRPISGTANGSTPTAEPGYQFDYWTADAADTGSHLTAAAGGKFIPSQEERNGINMYVARTYYAHFKEDDVTIRYEVGTSGGGSVTVASDHVSAVNGSFQTPDLNNDGVIGSTATAAVGYTFAGWATDSDGNNMVTDSDWVEDGKLTPRQADVTGKSYKVYEGKTYYAIFKAVGITVTYIYEGNTEYTNQNSGGSTATKSTSGVYNGRLDAAPTPAPTRIGYDFNSVWNTEPDGDGIAYTFGAYGTQLTEANGVVLSNDGLTRTLTLYAVWKQIPYSVKFDRNDGTAALSTVTRSPLYIDDTVTLPGVGDWSDKNGALTLVGYAKDPDATAADYNNDFLLDADEIEELFTQAGQTSVTLYGVWEDLNTYYTLTYNANGGAGNVPAVTDNHLGDDEVNLQNGWTDLARTGYEFIGWSENQNAAVSQPSVTFDTENITVYAVWKSKSYTVYFDGNGGAGAVVSATGLTLNGMVNLPNSAFSRDHYAFAGFDRNASAGYPLYTGTGIILTKDKINELFANDTETEATLYAVWNINRYTVTYNANGGTGAVTDGIAYNANSTVTVLGQGGIARAGYTFQGWSRSLSGLDYVAGSTFMIIGNTTLYAVWQQNPPPPADPVDPVDPPVDPVDPVDPTDPVDPVDDTPEEGPATWEPDDVVEALEEEEIPSVEIGEEVIPLFAGPYTGLVWALLNLILAIAGLALGVVSVMRSIARKKREEEGYDYEPDEQVQKSRKMRLVWFIVAVVMGVAGVVLFLFTENLTLPMVVMDNWTLANAAILLLEIAGMIFTFRKKEETDEDEPEA